MSGPLLVIGNAMETFQGFKVLAKYRCGSYAFGFENDNSDNDYILVLDGNSGIIVDKVNGDDIFAFDVASFKRKMAFDDTLLDYFVIFNDEVLCLDKSLVYLDEDFKEEFLSITKIDWQKSIKVWIQRNIDYFEKYVQFKEFIKKLYHLYRIRGLLSHYEETGKFENVYPKSYLEKAKEYKNQKEVISANYIDDFESIINYLKKYVESGGDTDG